MPIKDSQSGQYEISDNGAFVIHDYNVAKPFSSFLPGIAGVWGIPLWAYYVNRGQGMACFGTQDKDHMIMQFESAKLHQHRVGQEGFRTFIKIAQNDNSFTYYEPFRQYNPDYQTRRQMICHPHALEVIETNITLGLRITVKYASTCNLPFAALTRQVRIENTTDIAMQISLLDGCPKILPYGASFHLLQNLPFITEGYLQVSNLENKMPYINMKALASDSSVTGQLQAGNFFFSLLEEDTSLLDVLIDPETVFGPTGDLNYPARFLDAEFSSRVRQNQHCQTCSAFSHAAFQLPPYGQRNVLSLFGAADQCSELAAILKTAQTPDFFENNLEASERTINGIMDRFFMHSSSPELDAYARQTYLDNVLRGGLPVTIGTDEQKHVFHVYSRKHGDLERDYNLFELAATPWSQGNGNFRDVNQNRRHDVWFNPDVCDNNIRFFFNLLQPDGFNPLVCRGIEFEIVDQSKLRALLEEAIPGEHRQLLLDYLAKPFTPGELFSHLKAQSIQLNIDRMAFLNRLLANSRKIELAEFETGYWTDHWLYNFDLLRSYDAIYPDRLHELLVKDETFTYRDTDIRVLPRDEKYVLYDNDKVWHIDSIDTDAEKNSLIQQREYQPYCVRIDHGKGSVYTTNLLQKILCLLLNKLATIAPSGLGMDMDGGRPGWHDSINGIPGALGASTSEIYHLVRAIDWTLDAIQRSGVSNEYQLPIPEEMHAFFETVGHALDRYTHLDPRDNRDFNYWEETGTAKEAWRDATRFGFDGKEVPLPLTALTDWLQKARSHLNALLPRFVDNESGLPITYVTHEILDYEIITRKVPDTGETMTRTHPRGFPCVRIKAVRPHRLPLFLEAPTHYLRTEPGPEVARNVWQNVRRSPLYDQPLKMYLVGDSVEHESKDVGRIWAWPPGWFENENVFLHIEHKYLLALLHAEAFESFFKDFTNCLLPYQDMDRYARNPLENASFLVSSRHPRPDYHGRGFLPRTSGTTAEVLEMLLIMAFGKSPFRYTSQGLELTFDPILPEWLFSGAATTCQFYRADDDDITRVELDKNTFAASFLSHTLVVYHNPKRQATFGDEAVTVQAYTLTDANGQTQTYHTPSLPKDAAQSVRQRKISRIDVSLA